MISFQPQGNTMSSKQSTFQKEFQTFDFKHLAKRSAHPREKIRLLAFAHLKDGKSVREAADAVKVSRNAVYVWIRNFKKNELNGLTEKGGRGAKPKIALSESEAFRNAVLELQKNRLGGRIKGQDVLDMMKKEFGVTCTKRSAYNHLKRANLVWVSARSQHPNTDPLKQEEFKKNF
jgi:transposase